MKNDDDKKFEQPDLPDGGSNDAAPKEDPTELMLAAYLDGELDASERESLESQLESDPALRRRLNQLRQAWSLLDELEACPASKRFSETTLEMVALDAESHLKTDTAKKQRAIRRRRNSLGLGLLGALAIGFFLVWFFYPSRDAMLLGNLPVVAQLDQYEAAESVEFLEALVETKLFPTPTNPTPTKSSTKSPATQKKTKQALPPYQTPSLLGTKPGSLPPIPRTAGARRSWINGLESIPKAQLVQHWERFERLPPPEQQQLISLYHALETSGRSELLKNVMLQYNQWLQQQPSFNRTKLFDLPVSDRIAMIRKMRREELDHEGLQKWIKDNRKKLENRIKKFDFRNPFHKPGKEPEPGPHRGPGPGRGPSWRRNNLTRFMWFIQKEDMADLKNYLSEETAKGWDKKSFRQQQGWIFKTINQIQFKKNQERRFSAGSQTTSVQELAKFLKKMPEAQHAELLKLPDHLFHKKLIELYQKNPNHRRPPHTERPKNRRGQGQGRGQGRNQGRGNRWQYNKPKKKPSEAKPSKDKPPIDNAAKKQKKTKKDKNQK